MRSPLERRIASLRRQARTQLALHGLAWVVAGALLAVVFAGLLDWLFHLSRELRILALAGVLGLTGWLVWKYVLRPMVVQFRDLDIALKIEQRWPGLQDRLATTVQFLQLRRREDANEDLRGSRALRDETIRRTLDEAAALDFRDVIDPRPARRALASAALPMLLCAALLALAPAACRTAMSRLFAPLGSVEWPKQTHLAVHEPRDPNLRIARGDVFRLEVGVAPGELLPDNGEVTYHYENGEVVKRRLAVRDQDERLTDRLPEVTRSFTYTIAAGDDVTPPRRVEVVPPPALSHARVLITPPDYTGESTSIIEPLAGKTLPGSEFDVEGVLEGAWVEVQALTNKPVSAAALAALGAAPWAAPPPEGNSAATEAQSAQPPALPPPAVTIKPGGSQLIARFQVQAAGSFAFDLADPDGFRSQPREILRFNVAAVPDATPQVTIEEPPGNRDVTPNAVIPLAVRAEDDFGLGKIWLNYRVAAPGSEPVEKTPLVLWVPDEATPDPAEAAPRPSRDQLARFDWDLRTAGLDLPSGSVITLQACASDLDSIRGPKIGKSREIQIRILEPDALAQQLDDARRAIRDDIARTLEIQRQAIRPVEEAARTLEHVEQLREEDREAVRNAEAIQRQVTGRIADPVEGLERRIQRYLDDQRNLRIENPDAQAQMQDMLERTRSIRADHLNQAEESLSRANKGLDEQAGRQAQTPREANQADPDAPNARQPAARQPQDETRPSQAGKSAQTANTESPQGQHPLSEKARDKQAQSESSPASASDRQPTQHESPPKSDPSKSDAPQGPSQKNAPASNSDAPSRQPNNAGQAQTGEPPNQDEARPDSNAGQPREDLARAETEQKAIADELQQMLEQLGEFETYRGMVDEAKKLLNEQRETMQNLGETAERGRLEGRPANELNEQERADLENLGNRQTQVGDALRRLEGKMDELSQRIDPQDPLSSSALREASNQSRRRNTSAKAQDAGEQIARNQMGRAREQQREVEQDLKKLLDSLQNRRENELARLVKELKNAERELAELRQQQARNHRQTQQAGQNQNEQERRSELQRLAKEQQQIEEELRRQLQRLQKLRADNAARAGSRAAQRMSRAAQQQQQGDQDDAEAAAQEQDEALAQLEEAQDELEETRRQAEEQLAMEQLSRIRDDLANLSKRQDEMVTQTEVYSKIEREQAGLSLAQKKSVVGLGRAQEAIRDETTDLVDRLDAAPVFALIVKRASDAMERAAGQLRQANPGEEALAAERLAAKRFAQLLDALKPDQDGTAGGQQQSGGGGGGGGGAGGGMGDGIPTIAQLKLLKLLQEELNERTDSLDELRRRGKALSPDQESELARLHEEQRNVADLARDITRPRRDDGEE